MSSRQRSNDNVSDSYQVEEEGEGNTMSKYREIESWGKSRALCGITRGWQFSIPFTSWYQVLVGDWMMKLIECDPQVEQHALNHGWQQHIVCNGDK